MSLGGLSRLTWFRFQRAVGGHANDGDLLIASVAIGGEAELVELFRRIGHPLSLVPEGAKVPVPGTSYRMDEYERLAHPISAYPTLLQPKPLPIAGGRVSFSVSRREVLFAVAGHGEDAYSVGERDVAIAEAFEALARASGVIPSAP